VDEIAARILSADTGGCVADTLAVFARAPLAFREGV